MIRRKTKRDFRADKIRDSRHYKMLRHLLYYVRFKSAEDIVRKVWSLRLGLNDGKVWRFGLNDYDVKFVNAVLDAIIGSDFTYEILMKLGNIIYDIDWYTNRVIRQIGIDELPKEAFLFDVAGKNYGV